MGVPPSAPESSDATIQQARPAVTASGQDHRHLLDHGVTGELDLSGARYRVLTENIHDIVTEADCQGRFTYVSPSSLEICGYQLDEIVGRDCLDFVHPDDREHVATNFRACLKSTSCWPIEYRIHHKAGGWRWIESRPTLVRHGDGTPHVVVDVMRNITERKAAQAALAESERRYRLITDQASDMIMRLDRAGCVEFVSPACVDILGFEIREMLGKRFVDFIHPADHAAIREAYEGPSRPKVVTPADPCQFRGVHKAGHWIWLEGRPTCFFDPDTGALVGSQDVVRDITQRKALEVALEEARLEAENVVRIKADFLSNMSHELRTPLTAVIGFTRLIEGLPDLTAQARRYVAHISAGGRALLATINDVLDFSKIEAGQMEIRVQAVDLRSVIEETVNLLSIQALDKGLALVLQGQEQLPKAVFVASDRVRQVLFNLVGNAIKFTREGQVRVEVSYDDIEQRLKIGVQDSGEGLSKAHVARLFKRYAQVHAGTDTRTVGTGLGLSICKALVEAMGGEIGVVSERGVGSCFWFAIPAPATQSPLEAVSAPAPDRAAPPDLPGLRILVVDDNAANRELAVTMLAPISSAIIEAEDGLEAVESARDERFDVILMDMRMPRLGGIAAAAQIRQHSLHNGQTPIIAFSADIAERFDPALFCGVVPKPLDPAVLLNEIISAVDQRLEQSAPH